MADSQKLIILKINANKMRLSGLKDFHGNLENSNIEGIIGNGSTEVDVKSSQRACPLIE